jgi:hypothetical protein
VGFTVYNLEEREPRAVMTVKLPAHLNYYGKIVHPSGATLFKVWSGGTPVDDCECARTQQCNR